MLSAIRKEGRNGMLLYICPLCGHVFVNSKKYSKHLMKSHLRNFSMNKRKLKKLSKRLILIKVKEENGIPLDNFEKYLNLKAKLNSK